MSNERETLGSRLGFILLSAGCAIGLGNVWRFPYITGKNGGAGFVLIYILFLVILGLPIMAMEFAIGRAGKKNVAESLNTLQKKGGKWQHYGKVAIAGNYLLMMFYTTITGWLLYYFFGAVSGKFKGITADQSGAFFGALTSNPLTQILWMAIAIGVCMFVVSRGLRGGVEKVTKVMMLCLLAIMVVLAINSMTLPNASAGLKFYLIPNMQNMLDVGIPTVIFEAMGQAFFTLSLGIGNMLIFGSYIGKERALTGESLRIVGLDTFVAVMSGLIIFPACLSFGVNPGAGPSLIFITLPNIFANMPGSTLWASLFFLFMAFAALSTVIAVFENIISYWMDSHGWSRKKAALVNFIAIVALSIPCILGFNLWSGFQPLGAGTGVLDLEDFLVSNLILPLGSLIFVLFCTTRYIKFGKKDSLDIQKEGNILKSAWGWDNFLEEANTGSGLKFPTWARVYVTYVIPVIVVAVFIWGIISFFS